jgi:hypothetical protein
MHVPPPLDHPSPPVIARVGRGEVVRIGAEPAITLNARVGDALLKDGVEVGQGVTVNRVNGPDWALQVTDNGEHVQPLWSASTFQLPGNAAQAAG